MAEPQIPAGAIESLAAILAHEALFEADIGGYGWDSEKDSPDHFLPGARIRAREYLEAVAPYLHGKPETTDRGKSHTDS